MRNLEISGGELFIPSKVIFAKVAVVTISSNHWKSTSNFHIYTTCVCVSSAWAYPASLFFFCFHIQTKRSAAQIHIHQPPLHEFQITPHPFTLLHETPTTRQQRRQAVAAVSTTRRVNVTKYQPGRPPRSCACSKCYYVVYTPAAASTYNKGRDC